MHDVFGCPAGTEQQCRLELGPDFGVRDSMGKCSADAMALRAAVKPPQIQKAWLAVVP